MPGLNSSIFRFSDVEVHERELHIRRNGDVLPVEPKAFRVLLHLLRNPGRLVPKDELLDAGWGDIAVTENSLARNIALLRRLLGDDPRNPRYIETVSTVGYRFVSPVEVKEGATGTSIPAIEETTRVGNTDQRAGFDIPQSTVDHAVRRKWQKSWLAVVVILAVGGIVLSIGRYLWPRRQPFQKIRIEMIQPTVTGNQMLSAISRDGRFVAYASGNSPDCYEGGKHESLWIAQMKGVAVQIVPPDKVHYTGLAFSPDGDFLYFVRCRKDISSRLSALYKIPPLGGRAQRLIDDIEGTVTFSPDGKQLAFVRNSPNTQNNSELIVANKDGGGEKLIARGSVGALINSPAWSPDGKTIAFAKIDQGENHRLIEVPVKGGPERFLSNHRWAGINSLVWLSDGSGLIVAGADEVGEHLQIHYVSPVTGEVNRLTNDMDSYHGLSLTADSSLMAAVQLDRPSDIWVGTLTNPDKVSPISSGGRAMWPVWTPDGGIAYVAEEGARNNLWRMQADGSNSRPLTMETLGRTLWPRISPDGRYITFSRSGTGGWHLWRVDIDGNNPLQLTRDAHEGYTDTNFSPDGKWVVFAKNWDNGVGGIWKISIDGGDPILVAKGFVDCPVVSPDGKKIAYNYWDEKTVPSRGVAIMAFEGGPPIRRLDVPADALAWTPDGHSLLLGREKDGVWNLWIQSLVGGPSRQITHFDVGAVDSFDLSKDGKRLVMSHFTESSHVVLIRDLR